MPADAGHGVGAAFRRGLNERGLTWAVGIPEVRDVHSTAVELLRPTARTGRPRKHPVPSEEPVPAGRALADAERRRVARRRGTKGPLAAEFAALRVRPTEGAQLGNGRHLPGEEVWLVGERRGSGEREYCLANLPEDATPEELAATIKARRVCEQAHQQLKEDLGLGRFEGRSWTGLHRHALMAMIALCFLQHLRLERAGRRGKKRTSRARPAAATHPAGGPAPAAWAASACRRLPSPLRRQSRTCAARESAQVVPGPRRRLRGRRPARRGDAGRAVGGAGVEPLDGDAPGVRPRPAPWARSATSA